MDDFDNLLARLNRLNDFFADGFDFKSIDKVFNDRQGDICLKQRYADFTHRCRDILFRQRPTSREVIENIP